MTKTPTRTRLAVNLERLIRDKAVRDGVPVSKVEADLAVAIRSGPPPTKNQYRARMASNLRRWYARERVSHDPQGRVVVTNSALFFPTPETIDRLAAALEVDPTELFREPAEYCAADRGA